MRANSCGRFEIVAKAKEFEWCGRSKPLSRQKIAFSEVFTKYESPYGYLQKLKEIEALEEAEYFKYLVKIEYKILNAVWHEVSEVSDQSLISFKKFKSAQNLRYAAYR
ncbi:MAG: hypothetical protein R3E50_01740 [Halioglobus sp.]